MADPLKICDGAWKILEPKIGADAQAQRDGYTDKCTKKFADIADTQCVSNTGSGGEPVELTEEESIACTENLAITKEWVKLQLTPNPEVVGFCKDFVARMKEKAPEKNSAVDEGSLAKACEELTPTICSTILSDPVLKGSIAVCIDGNQDQITTRADALTAEAKAADDAKKAADEEAKKKADEAAKGGESKRPPIYISIPVQFVVGKSAGLSVNGADPVLEYNAYALGIAGGVLLTKRDLGDRWGYRTKTGLLFQKTALERNNNNNYGNYMNVWGLGPEAAAQFTLETGSVGSRYVFAPETAVLFGALSTSGPVNIGLLPQGRAFEVVKRRFVADFYTGVSAGLEMDGGDGMTAGFNIGFGWHIPLYNNPVTNTPPGMGEVNVSLVSFTALKFAMDVFF